MYGGMKNKPESVKLGLTCGRKVSSEQLVAVAGMLREGVEHQQPIVVDGALLGYFVNEWVEFKLTGEIHACFFSESELELRSRFPVGRPA